MKKVLLFVFFCILTWSVDSLIFATDSRQYIECLPNGTYYVTEVEECDSIMFLSNTKTAKKTTKFYNSNGSVVWFVSVSATFSYSNTGSTCVNASVTAGSYDAFWKIISKSSNKRGNIGIANAVAGHYFNNNLLNKYSRSVSISCDRYGNIS